MLIRGGQKSDGMQGESESAFRGEILAEAPCIFHAARVAVRDRVTDEAKYRQHQNHAAIDAKREAHEYVCASVRAQAALKPAPTAKKASWESGEADDSEVAAPPV